VIEKLVKGAADVVRAITQLGLHIARDQRVVAHAVIRDLFTRCDTVDPDVLEFPLTGYPQEDQKITSSIEASTEEQ